LFFLLGSYVRSPRTLLSSSFVPPSDLRPLALTTALAFALSCALALHSLCSSSACPPAYLDLPLPPPPLIFAPCAHLNGMTRYTSHGNIKHHTKCTQSHL
jgi:hypothetical protein